MKLCLKLIVKQNKAIWENGALLSSDSHHYLNYLDYNEHILYNELNWLFFELNRTYEPPTEDYYEEVKHILRKSHKDL